MSLFLVIALGLELVARLLPSTRDAGVIFKQVEPGKWRFLPNDQGKPFAVPKPKGRYRVFCFGGSATVGAIYNPVSSFPKQLELMLSDLARGGPVEVLNVGRTAYNSDDVLMVFQQALAFEPDLMIVYCGNNELTEYRPYNRIETPILKSVLTFLAAHSQFYRAAEGRVPNMLAVFGWVAMIRENIDLKVDVNLYPPPRRAIIKQNYLTNMERIIDLAEAHRTPLYLCTMAANLREWPPLKSWYPDEMPKAERQRIEAEVGRIEERLAAGEVGEARSDLAKIFSVHPDHARARFLLGRIEFEQGNYEAARAAFDQALDHDDAAVMRAPSYHNQALIELAKQRRVSLIDIHDLFNQRGEQGIAGYEYLDDYCHPNLAGQSLLAATFAARIGADHPDRFEGRAIDELMSDPARWPARLGITPDFLARRAQEMAFYLAFLRDDRFVTRQARVVFGRMREYGPDSTLPFIGESLIELRAGDRTAGIEELNQALRLSPVHLAQMVGLYFPRFLRFDPPYLMVQGHPGIDYRPLLNDYLAVTGVSPNREITPLSIDGADLILEWPEAGPALLDRTALIASWLERRRTLFGQGARPPAKTIFSAGQPEGSIAPVNFINSGPSAYQATGRDPQLIFSGRSIDPILYGTIRVKATVTPKDRDAKEELCVYWAGQTEQEFGERCKRCVPLPPMAAESEWEIEVGEDPDWILSGLIFALRLDPSEGESELHLESIELEPWRREGEKGVKGEKG